MVWPYILSTLVYYSWDTQKEESMKISNFSCSHQITLDIIRNWGWFGALTDGGVAAHRKACIKERGNKLLTKMSAASPSCEPRHWLRVWLQLRQFHLKPGLYTLEQNHVTLMLTSLQKGALSWLQVFRLIKHGSQRSLFTIFNHCWPLIPWRSSSS